VGEPLEQDLAGEVVERAGPAADDDPSAAMISQRRFAVAVAAALSLRHALGKVVAQFGCGLGELARPAWSPLSRTCLRHAPTSMQAPASARWPYGRLLFRLLNRLAVHLCLQRRARGEVGRNGAARACCDTPALD
jgi:hypothetical protein